MNPPTMSSSRGLANKQSIELWHRRLGHRNIPDIRKMFHQRLTKGDLVALQSQPPTFCEACVIGKVKRLPFPKQSKPKDWRLLERIDIDECGPLPVRSLNGERYFISFCERKSKAKFTFLLHEKRSPFEVQVIEAKTREAHWGVRLNPLWR